MKTGYKDRNGIEIQTGDCIAIVRNHRFTVYEEDGEFYVSCVYQNDLNLKDCVQTEMEIQ